MAVLYEKKDRIAKVTLNRPEAFNSISPDVLKELGKIMEDFNNDPDMWIAIVTGAGDKAFCAGADIKQTIAGIVEGKLSLHMADTILRGQEVWKPLIAAVNGVALGGGLEIVLACDIRIAAQHAIFGVPEVKLGIFPGWGGTQRLARAIPLAKAMEMLLTGEPIDAQEAYRVGLVNKVVPQAELLATAQKYAENICSNAPMAVRAAKESMMKGRDMTLDLGLRFELLLADSLKATEDLKEGAKAFIEKRKPHFTGK